MNTSDLQWKGKFWGPRGALEKRRPELWAKVHSSDPHERFNGLHEFSSLYYSASGDALQARAPRAGWLGRIFWYVIGWWYLELALHYSNRAWCEEFAKFFTPSVCDVRQSVCRAGAHLPLRRRRCLERANEAITMGLWLSKLPEHKPSMHTRPLLLIGKADVMLRTGEPRADVVDILNNARARADMVTGHFAKDSHLPAVEYEKRQYARVYRHLSRLYAEVEHFREAGDCHEIAIRLATEAGADGQLSKML